MAKAKNKKREDGLVQVSLVIGTSPNGNPKRKYFYGHTAKEAEAKKADYQEKLRRGVLAANEKATFGEIATAWLAYKRGQLGEQGLKRYNRYVSIVNNQLQPILPRRIRELKPADLDIILAEYAERGKAKKTIKEYKQTASQVIDYAMENDIVFRNVFAKVKLPAANETERTSLTEEQQDLINKYWEGHRAGIGAILMMYCGLRRGELIPLTWADIDLSNKTITINKSVRTASNIFTVKQGAKTDAGCRVVEIFDCVIPALTRAKASSNSFLVLPDVKGQMLTNQGFVRLWDSFMEYLNSCAGGSAKKRIANEHGKYAFAPRVQAMEPFTAHQLRHTYATILYDHNVDPKSAQKLLGHASIEMTLKVYTHLSQSKKDDSISKVNEGLKAKGLVL